MSVDWIMVVVVADISVVVVTCVVVVFSPNIGGIWGISMQPELRNSVAINAAAIMYRLHSICL